MTNPTPKKSLPVLAYLTPEPLSLSCFMRVCHKDDKQLSIALLVPVTLYGAETEQTVVVQYDADNIHSAARPTPSTLHKPAGRLQNLARHAEPEPDTTTVTLSLKQVPPVWCPRGQVLTPEPNAASVSAHRELVELVKATKVHLVFDPKWLDRAKNEAIQRLIKGRVNLNSYPLDKYYSKDCELKDWTHFAPALPTEASIKRARPGKHTPTGHPRRLH